jgi:putative transposase
MCTDRRRKVFVDPDNAISVQVQLLSTASAYAIEVVAHSLMPDHLHALLAGTTENSDPLKCCDVFRSRTGFHHRARHRRRLWQEGYYDRLLRDNESTFDVVSYIVMNPVRAGLARTASEYPYSGSSRYSLEEITEFVHWRPDSVD